MSLFSQNTSICQQSSLMCNNGSFGKEVLTKEAHSNPDQAHNSAKLFTCFLETCGKQFGLRSSLKKHERIHREERPYECTQCDLAFTQISNLRRHERLHAGLKPHVCNICSKAFSTQSNLREHSKIHENEQERPKFECSKCKKLYLYQSSLNKHLKSHDRVERTHPNDYLGQTFQSSYKLQDGLYESAIFLEGSSPEKKLVCLEGSDSTVVLLPRAQESQSTYHQSTSDAVLLQQLDLGYPYLGYPSSSQYFGPKEDLSQGFLNHSKLFHFGWSHRLKLKKVQINCSIFPGQGTGIDKGLRLESVEDVMLLGNPQIDFERTLSAVSARSRAEEDDQIAELERRCDQMIQFDSSNDFSSTPKEFDENDALTIRLQYDNVLQNYEPGHHTPLKYDMSSLFDGEQMVNADENENFTRYSFFE